MNPARSETHGELSWDNADLAPCYRLQRWGEPTETLGTLSPDALRAALAARGLVTVGDEYEDGRMLVQYVQLAPRGWSEIEGDEPCKLDGFDTRSGQVPPRCGCPRCEGIFS